MSPNWSTGISNALFLTVVISPLRSKPLNERNGLISTVDDCKSEKEREVGRFGICRAELGCDYRSAKRRGCLEFVVAGRPRTDRRPSIWPKN